MPNCSDCRPPPTWTPRLADRTEAPPTAGSHLQRPYPHATDDPGAVRHDHHIVAEPVHYLRGEASGIATADVQAVPQVHRPQLIHHPADPTGPRSEEHTSELQSRFELVCRLLLENTNTLDLM